jgi:hypothetical protein
VSRLARIFLGLPRPVLIRIRPSRGLPVMSPESIRYLGNLPVKVPVLKHLSVDLLKRDLRLIRLTVDLLRVARGLSLFLLVLINRLVERLMRFPRLF